MSKLTILGSTGTIGVNTLDVVVFDFGAISGFRAEFLSSMV